MSGFDTHAVLVELRAIRELLTAAADRIPRSIGIDELADRLDVSRRTIEKARRAGTFPIPEIKGISSDPKWSSDVVAKFMNGELAATRPDRRGRFAIVKSKSA